MVVVIEFGIVSSVNTWDYSRRIRDNWKTHMASVVTMMKNMFLLGRVFSK
jgi:hypothetical protein